MVTRNNSNMSITVEKVSEFNLDESDWKTYIKQLEFFLKQI